MINIRMFHNHTQFVAFRVYNICNFRANQNSTNWYVSRSKSLELSVRDTRQKQIQSRYLLSEFTFAIETRSGLILYLSQPNIVPSLPNAQITYNANTEAV